MKDGVTVVAAWKKSHDDQMDALRYEMEVTARILAEKKREQRIKNILLAIGILALVVVVAILIYLP